VASGQRWVGEEWEVGGEVRVRGGGGSACHGTLIFDILIYGSVYVYRHNFVLIIACK
jgi:hypothetical protein